MTDIAPIFFIIFGLITIGGGIQGALKGSKASLIAGGILGLLILAGGFLVAKNATLAYSLALVGSLGVAGKFVPGFFKTRAIWPAGVLGILGVIGLVLGVLGLVAK